MFATLFRGGPVHCEQNVWAERLRAAGDVVIWSNWDWGMEIKCGEETQTGSSRLLFLRRLNGVVNSVTLWLLRFGIVTCLFVNCDVLG